MVYLMIYLFAVMWGFIIWKVATLRSKRGRKLYLIPVFTVLFLIAGLRGYSVGEDTGAYADIFLKLCVRSVPEVAKETAIESLHLYFMKGLTNISGNPQIYFLVTSLIIYLGIGKFIYDHSENVCISTLIFIGLYYIGTMSVVRQYMAIAIVSQSITALKNKRYRLAVAYSLFGLLFHKSAIIFWGIEILYLLHREKIYLPVFTAGVFFAWAFYKSGLMIKAISLTPYAHYIGSKYMKPSQTGGTINKVLFLITALTFFYLWILHEYELKETGKTRDRKEQWFYLSMVAVNCLILAISRQHMVFMRFAIYFVIFLFPLIPAIFKELKRLRWIAYTVLAFCMLGTVLIMTSGIPYDFLIKSS